MSEKKSDGEKYTNSLYVCFFFKFQKSNGFHFELIIEFGFRF